MKPLQLLNLPELARVVGLPYSLIYSAYISGDLVPHAIGSGRPFFEETRLVEAARCLQNRLSRVDFEEILSRAALEQGVRAGYIKSGRIGGTDWVLSADEKGNVSEVHRSVELPPVTAPSGVSAAVAHTRALNAVTVKS